MAQMGDSFGDGWTNGSNLSIKVDDIEIVSIQWTCGGSGSNKVYSCTQFFTIEAPPEWQYSATAQTSSSWTTGELDWTSYTGNFPAPTTTTRYFRRSLQMTGTDNFGIRVTLTVNGGAVVYVNGQELTRWNLPESDISSTTQATVSTTGKHNYVQLLAALPTPVNDTYIVAVEVHAGSTTPSSEAFDCSVSFLSDDYRLIDSDGSYTCVPDGVLELLLPLSLLLTFGRLAIMIVWWLISMPFPLLTMLLSEIVFLGRFLVRMMEVSGIFWILKLMWYGLFVIRQKLLK